MCIRDSAEPNDYEKILEDDKISLIGLSDFSEKKPIQCVIEHAGGKSEEILLNHSYNNSQIEWFKAGSAMNVLKNK